MVDEKERKAKHDIHRKGQCVEFDDDRISQNTPYVIDFQKVHKTIPCNVYR
jgi:hypothetical protein